MPSKKKKDEKKEEYVTAIVVHASRAQVHCVKDKHKSHRSWIIISLLTGVVNY